MINEIVLSIVQSATEFLPISSSGHLALVTLLVSSPNLFLFTALHLASLLAVLLFTRREVYRLVTFERKYRRMWLFIIIGTIPAVLFGGFFREFISAQFYSLKFISATFLITGIVLFSTKNAKTFSKLNYKNSFAIGVAQMFALFPGISRSGMTISSARYLGIKPEEAFKFSFLLFIPAGIGAVLLELGEFYFSFSLLVSFILTFFLSLFFLSLLYKIIKRGKFWLFSFYCFAIAIVSFWLSFYY